MAWLSIKLPFSTNQAMEEALLNFAVVDLSLKKFMSDALILLASPYMEIRIEYLNRVSWENFLRIIAILFHKYYNFFSPW